MTTGKLDDGAVTNSKLGADAVTAAKIKDGEVAAAKLAPSAVETAKIKDGAVTPAKLSASAKPVAWYPPSIIDAEESRTNTTYGTLATADEIKGVVMPTNGLIVVGFTATVKSSVSAAGGLAIFLGSNQVYSGAAPAKQEAVTVGTAYSRYVSSDWGIARLDEIPGSPVSTGQILGSQTDARGGVCWIFADAGTYDISVKFKASSGSVTAKERKLWVYTLGS